jgi:hypothetical protein
MKKLFILFGVIFGLIALISREYTAETAPNFGVVPVDPEDLEYRGHDGTLREQNPELFIDQ